MTASLTSSLLATLPWLDHCFQAAGMTPPEGTRYVHQRHSAVIVCADAAFPPKSCDGDGVIGTGTEPVAVYTADCLPVLIADNHLHHVAAVHGGLKGVMSGVINQAVDKLLALGSQPQHLFVAIGPAIGPCCYELGEDILQRLNETALLSGLALPWSHQAQHNIRAIRPQAPVHPNGIWFDLPALAQQLLLRKGIPAAQIEQLSVCTYCMAEEKASYRRNTHIHAGYALRFSWIRQRAESEK
ncbi:polyphenol oxidase family protein [Enterobacteriaceae bacterium LUAb1]